MSGSPGALGALACLRFGLPRLVLRLGRGLDAGGEHLGRALAVEPLPVLRGERRRVRGGFEVGRRLHARRGPRRRVCTTGVGTPFSPTAPLTAASPVPSEVEQLLEVETRTLDVRGADDLAQRVGVLAA